MDDTKSVEKTTAQNGGLMFLGVGSDEDFWDWADRKIVDEEFAGLNLNDEEIEVIRNLKLRNLKRDFGGGAEEDSSFCFEKLKKYNKNEV